MQHHKGHCSHSLSFYFYYLNNIHVIFVFPPIIYSLFRQVMLIHNECNVFSYTLLFVCHLVQSTCFHGAIHKSPTVILVFHAPKCTIRNGMVYNISLAF